MGIQFNADEVFAIAIKIEENGAAFYRRAQSLHGESPHVKTLENLAKMEDVHKKIFEEMRQKLTPAEKAEQSYDPFAEAVLYLKSVADFHGGEGTVSARDKLTGKESIGEIIDIALDLEKKSILYYLGLKDLVPAHLGRDKIDLVIGEEKKHVAQLSQIKAQL